MAKRPRRVPPPTWVWPFIGLLTISVGSAVVITGGLAGLVGLKVGFFYTLVAFVLWQCPLSARERDLLVTILIVNGLITSGIGIAQQVAGPEALHALGYRYNTTVRAASGHLRAFSTFNQDFPFGMYVMTSLLVSLPVALREPGRLRNRLFLLALPVYLLGLAASTARSAFVGLAAGLTFLVLVRGSYRRILWATPFLAAAVLLLSDRLLAAFLSTKSGSERISIWKDALASIDSHPLGLGLGSTGSAAEKARALSSGLGRVLQPDNYYLKVLLELGVVGLWLFLLWMVYAFVGTRHAASNAVGADQALFDGISAFLVAAVVVAASSTFFEVFPMDVYMFVFVGLVASWAPESG